MNGSSTQQADSIGVGVIGLGFMGRVHLEAYNYARESGCACHLAAICDAQPQRATGQESVQGNIESEGGSSQRLFDPEKTNCYTDPAELLADPTVQAVSICTPTDSHVNLAIQALKAGKHVLIEKPVAVTAEEVQRVADIAAANPRLRCMPALCMRFWPGWTWFKQRIDDQRYGRVRSAVFTRLAARPGWSHDFYLNAERSGGALVDLHIHDADFVRHCFGDPASVSSVGTIHHLTTTYRFDDDIDGLDMVVAEGGWDLADGFAFRMRYLVKFENATADFDLARDKPLTLTHEGQTTPVGLPEVTGYQAEIRHFLDAIADPELPLRASIDDALAVARLLDSERHSLDCGQPVNLGG